MKRYNRCRSSLSSSFIHYPLLVVMLGLFLSSPLWLPTLCTSMKLFFIELIPKIVAVILGPTCSFIVFNLIIIFLVREWRNSTSSTKHDVYEEYMTHTQRLRGISSSEGKGNEGEFEFPSIVEKIEEKKEEEKEEEKREIIEEEVEEEGDGEEEEVKKESEVLMEEDEEREELNKRVENFIARVNMQRRMEARMLVCCG